MMLYMRKKFLKDERVLQLVLLLSLLRIDADTLLGLHSGMAEFPHDLILGPSVGHTSTNFHEINNYLNGDVHPKSVERLLGDYQRHILADLNALGRYTDNSSPPLDATSFQAYLLNSQNVLGSPATGDSHHHALSPTSPPPPVVLQPLENHDPPVPDTDPPPLEFITAGDELTPEDMALIETLWKQDVDLGVPRQLFSDQPTSEPATKDKDHGKKPMSETEIEEKPEDDPWTRFNLTIDSETGEHLLTSDDSNNATCLSDGSISLRGDNPSLGSPSLAATAPDHPGVNNDSVPDLNLEFNLDEALKLVGLNCSETGETVWKNSSEEIGTDGIGGGDFGTTSPGSKSAEEGGLSDSNSSIAALDTLNDTLDEMIQASHLHSLHPRSLQGRLGGLVRTGSMEQRWQDLASLLSLPSPDPAHAHAQSPTPASMAAHGGHGAQGPLPHSPLHHPQALYPTHHHDASTTPTAPTPAPIPRGVLLQNATLPPPMPDPMSHNITYSNSMGASSHLVASSMNLTNSSDLPGSEHAHHPHYKMENNASLPPDMMYYQNTSSEINQTDGFLSSILNDEDLQLMDIAMNDYGNPRNTAGEYQGGSGSYRYPIEDPHRHHPQKKHQMFGKRYFQDNNHGSPSGLGGGAGLGGFSGHYPHPSHHGGSMEGATALDPAEMKYSCTMDFRAQGNELSGGSVEHVQHNHTYHMSPEGPSGLSRPSARDKKSSKRSEADRSLTRDEKRARALNVPITCEDIINLPMDEFNERISKYDLTEPQLSLIRDIRRRGKNKVAAQNCRKRKLDQITHLAEEVKLIQNRKTELRNEYEYLTNERARVKNKFSLLYRHIFQSLRDPDGNPYSPTEYSLQQSADGNILLVPRTSNHTMDTTSGSKPRHHAKEGENQ